MKAFKKEESGLKSSVATFINISKEYVKKLDNFSHALDTLTGKRGRPLKEAQQKAFF